MTGFVVQGTYTIKLHILLLKKYNYNAHMPESQDIHVQEHCETPGNRTHNLLHCWCSTTEPHRNTFIFKVKL